MTKWSGAVVLKTKEYKAIILPQRGANCISLRHLPTGYNILRTPKKEQYFTKESPFLWGMPLLFFPNRIQEGRFVFNQMPYQFAVNEQSTNCHIHGSLHQTEFAVKEATAAKAVLVYEATEKNLYAGYPHAFAVQVSYTLGQDGLCQTTCITNKSETEMPVALAFHTTFNLAFLAEANPYETELQLAVSQEYERNHRLLPTGRLLPRVLPSKPAGHMLTALMKREDTTPMQLANPNSRRRIVYEADATFTCWMVYNGGTAEYICVEPQTWVTNAPNVPLPQSETGMLSLVPGESKTFTTAIRVE